MPTIMDKSSNIKEENSRTLKLSIPDDEDNGKNVPAEDVDEKDIPAQTKKPRRRDKSDLGENFIAPDGGLWAWLVCIAAGASNLSIYPCLQQFGFLFRDRLIVLGMTSSQVTTIINTNSAMSACTGLLNGPMFRRFSYRQVGMVGSLLIFIGISITAFCKTFLGYMVSYSLLYGFGMGISVSASALAINTYFKNKRRRATGFSWTITGLGPIFLPHVVTFLLTVCSVEETVLIFAVFSLQSFISALIYQPAQYHTKKPEDFSASNGNNDPPTTYSSPEPEPYKCKFCEMQQHKEHSIFSSQYLYQEDDEDMPGYEIIEPGTPMLSRANDGWFGSKLSLASQSGPVRFRTVSSSKDLEQGQVKRLDRVISEEELNSEGFFRPNYFRRERDEALKRSNSKSQFSRENSTAVFHCTCAEERALMEQTILPIETDELLKKEKEEGMKNPQLIDDSVRSGNISFFRKVVVFFDLDLLRDFTYVNLVIGLTAINFGELNFSILTPFILKDFGFDTKQMTLATSVLGTMDLIMRFLVPFITEKMTWDNRIFFLIGVVGIALGRTVVACTRSYNVIICAFVFIGISKGVRTIFWPLIIPSYVPLKRLPAASGLQLLISGLFTLAAGPFVGIVRDRYNYSVAVHCLNCMSFFAAFAWTSEAIIRRYRRKQLRKE